MSRLEEVLDEITKVERVHKGEKDILYFGMTYFSEDGNPDNADNLIPKGVNEDNAADFHKELTDILGNVSSGNVRRHFGLAVPRRHAKTAWLSNIFLLHQIVYRKKTYIVLYSQTTDTAGDFISWGRYQLKLNEMLRNDFGELLYPKSSRNELDNKYEYITLSRSKVSARGLGVQTRGLRFGSVRPQIAIIDDAESDESTNTQELIEKSKAWFNESLLPALSRDGICVYLGTILCHGSLLYDVIHNRKDFQTKLYSAVINEPTNEGIWNEWKEIRRTDHEDSADHAYQFYLDNENEMLEGVEILWPGYFTYYELACIKEDLGPKTYNQEFANNPIDEERQIFKPEYFYWYTDEDLEGKELEFYGATDPALGKESGDYSAVVTLAKNAKTGVCYVYDVFLERVHPDVLLEQVVSDTLKYQYEGLGVEAVAYQEFLADKISEELMSKGYPSLTRMRKIKNRSRKALRIESMLPDVQSGKLRFHEKFRNSEFMAQFELYGSHRFDDGIDCCEMAFRTASGDNAVVRTLNNKRMR